MQQHDERLYPGEYASKKLASAKTNYSTLEKECLSIVWGIKKFRLYLAGKPFMLQTDHQPLAYINKTKYQNNCIMQWVLSLQGYDYTVQAGVQPGGPLCHGPPLVPDKIMHKTNNCLKICW